MKSYRDDTGVFHRTQADAKASGRPFELVDIPTDHAGLIAFVNGLRANPEPTSWPVLGPDEEGNVATASDLRIGDRPISEYKNGDPTVPVMKSRDPMARFTCRACGTVNAPEPDR